MKYFRGVKYSKYTKNGMYCPSVLFDFPNEPALTNECAPGKENNKAMITTTKNAPFISFAQVVTVKTHQSLQYGQVTKTNYYLTDCSSKHLLQTQRRIRTWLHIFDGAFLRK